MTYKSFLPATKFDHSLAVDQIGGNLRVRVGSNRAMTSVITPETALEVAAFLKEAAEKILRGPEIRHVDISPGAPPAPEKAALDHVCPRCNGSGSYFKPGDNHNSAGIVPCDCQEVRAFSNNPMRVGGAAYKGGS